MDQIRVLSPEENKRLIQTISAAQVRQPVYRTSIGRWKPFASELAPAEPLLRPLIERHERELAARGISVQSGGIEGNK